MSHSTEPWSWGSDSIEDADGRTIIATGEASREDLDRIVACVNFCREFSTKWLQGRKLRFDGFLICQLIPAAKENA